MPRVKRGFKARKRRKKVLKAAKGYRGGQSKLFKTASIAVRRRISCQREQRLAHIQERDKGVLLGVLLSRRRNGQRDTPDFLIEVRALVEAVVRTVGVAVVRGEDDDAVVELP